jgi:hypothetical protein
MIKPKFQEGKIKMIDISDAKYDFSKEEKYVIRWFNENGFTGKIIKQYVSKTVFEISRDGFSDKFELPQGITFTNIKGYMSQFVNNWKMFCELQELKMNKT